MPFIASSLCKVKDSDGCSKPVFWIPRKTRHCSAQKYRFYGGSNLFNPNYALGFELNGITALLLVLKVWFLVILKLTQMVNPELCIRKNKNMQYNYNQQIIYYDYP